MIFSFYILNIIKHKIRKNPVRNKKVYQKKGSYPSTADPQDLIFPGKMLYL